MKTLHIRNAAIALIAGAGLVAAPLYADMHGNKEMGKGGTGGAAMMGDPEGRHDADVQHDARHGRQHDVGVGRHG